MEEAEELLRHALSVHRHEFVEGESGTLKAGPRLAFLIKKELAKVLVQTDHHEEAGLLIQRICELAERSDADPIETVEALQLAVDFQVRRGDSAQAWAALQVLPSDSISHPPVRDSWNPDPNSHLRHKLQPAVAGETLVACTCSGTTRADQ